MPEDNAEAVRWWRQAAEQGHAKAQFCLGLCYYFGKGVTADKAEAVGWLRRAAKQRVTFDGRDLEDVLEGE